MRLLLVEDEVRLARILKTSLERERYAVDLCSDGETGYMQAGTEEYDLLILDIGLPKKSGIEMTTSLRNDGITTPILMLTARDSVSDKTRGLDSGADDYLVKPFDFEELLARIRALLRRNAADKPLLFQIDSLELDPISKIVKRTGKEIPVSAKEYALLEYLMRNPNQILSKTQILDHVWDSATNPFTNTVDVYIGYVRKKIDKAFPKEKPLIRTVKGLGYKIGS
ncbi:MAG: response regulator transcription factor [bacterium]|nr:response regulator transcription factor [bacterium]